MLSPSDLISPVSSYALSTMPTRRSALTMKKGRLGKDLGVGAGGKKSQSLGGDDVFLGSKSNWLPVSGVKSMKDLPKETGKILLVETMAKALTDPRTNPNGAVGILNYDSRTYCVSSSCMSCKIPMTKAKILPPNEETGNSHPRIECDFCGATYNARTGKSVTEGGSDRGIMGGVMKGLFASKDKVDLPTYDLGEQNGKIMINLP